MSLSSTGDWKIVMHADGVDSEGKNTYQHIYQHKDGRKAYVVPGYCSDPDLEWILFQKDRETKLPEDLIHATLLMRWNELEISAMSQNQFARCIGRLKKKFKQEEAERFYETALKMIQTKKKGPSPAEKECLDYIAKRFKISH